MTLPFSNPLDRVHAKNSINAEYAENDIAQCNEAAARMLLQAVRRLRANESVRDVFSALVDPVIALSGRV